MNNTIKKDVIRFCKQYRIKSFDKDVADDILKQLGYLVIYYNYILNDEPVSSLIKKLSLEDEIKRSKGFTYVDGRHRLVFINEDLSDDEQIIVLAHEIGHIICNHFSHQSIIGKDVQEEYEANEFAHYLLKDNLRTKLSRSMQLYKQHILITSIVIVVVCIIGITVWYPKYEETIYYGDYYVTESGQKYHKKNCIFVKDKSNVHRLTKEEYDSGIYEPCQICLP